MFCVSFLSLQSYLQLQVFGVKQCGNGTRWRIRFFLLVKSDHGIVFFFSFSLIHSFMSQAWPFFFSDRVLLFCSLTMRSHILTVPVSQPPWEFYQQCILVNLDSLVLYDRISKMSCIKWRLMYSVDGLETRQPR